MDYETRQELMGLLESKRELIIRVETLEGDLRKAEETIDFCLNRLAWLFRDDHDARSEILGYQYHEEQ